MATCLLCAAQSRWLHLFQLVEKQYQEQILAQQEQYQCQIQVSQNLTIPLWCQDKTQWKYFLKYLSSFFSSWSRMKSKPWFSSRTARPASNWTLSSLQLQCPKLPQTPRTIFTRHSPVTVCSPKSFPATTLTWKRLPVPSSPPLKHLRVRKVQTMWRSREPLCSAVATAPCLPGMQVWNLLSLQETTSVNEGTQGKVTVSPVTERTQSHWCQEAGSIQTARKLSKWRRPTSVSTSREQPCMSGVLQGENAIFFFKLFQNITSHLEKVLFSWFCLQYQQCFDILGTETEAPD